MQEEMKKYQEEIDKANNSGGNTNLEGTNKEEEASV